MYILLVGLFLIARTGGMWSEPDSSVFARIIRDFAAEGRLVPVEGSNYPNGYTFQAISTFILAVTGLDVAMLQQVIYPLLAGVVVIPAWVLFRELIGTARGAALATFLLLSQPEFLFVIMRSSHEKFSRALVLLCLFLLVRSFRLHDQPRAFVKYVLMFYLAAFALIASNNLLAHSFIFAVGVALVIGRLLHWRSKPQIYDNRLVFKRLQYVVLTCIVVVYIFTFYVYEPAQHQFIVVQSIWDHVAGLFLQAEESTATNAYGAVNTGWTSLRIYLLASLANWVVMLVSLTIWSWQGLRWLVRREMPATQGQWVLWMLYAAFAAQGALSIVIDMSGAMSANMQQRLFPSFAIFAVAIVAGALDRWQPRRLSYPARTVLATGMFCFAVLSVMKATNEPLISNTWTFYRPDEIAALEWSDEHLTDATIWTDYDARLLMAQVTLGKESTNGNIHYGGGLHFTSRDVVLSSTVRLRSVRLNRPLPMPADSLRVYDNGRAEVYHLRPTTPFQP